MNDNTLSLEEGWLLLKDLCDKQTPIYALFNSKHIRSKVVGELYRVAEGDNLVVSTTSPPTASVGSLRIDLNRDLAFSFGDASDPKYAVPEDLIINFGTRVLFITFHGFDEFLVLTYTE